MTRIIVLASTSAYRRQLLSRLGLPFEVRAPGVDEARAPGEDPEALVTRLSAAKARAVAHGFPDALVIGSDQVAVLHGEVLGKPGSFEANVAQLRRASGQDMTFLTALTVHDTLSGRARTEVERFTVSFRSLSEREIDAYVARERAFDCAGGVKAEGLGVALVHRMRGDDPTAMIGLPLIRLCSMLRAAGLDVLDRGQKHSPGATARHGHTLP